MRYCTHCGTQIADDARFCNHCGNQVASAAPSAQAFPPQSFPSPRNAPYSSAQVGSAPEVDTSSTMVLAVLGLLCCLPLAIWSIIQVSRAKSAGSQEEADRLLSQAKTLNWINIAVGAVSFVVAFLAALASN
ncbi:MAG TPA: zinc-ribbon domain-containing protein [Fibrobacteria bacterium]|nr:zinc-ribbon domain-containing protein [Fibrobacteria bacterium]